MKPLSILAVVLCLITNHEGDAADRACTVGPCPQTSSEWTIYPDSSPGAPDFWWKPEAVDIEVISLCPHGIHFVFSAEQDGCMRPTALVFPSPSPGMLAERLGLEPGSAKLAAESEHFQQRYADLLSALEKISRGALVGSARASFAPTDPDDPRLVPNCRLALLWHGEELPLRGYLDVYFGELPVVAEAEDPGIRLETGGATPEDWSAPLRIVPNPGRAGEYQISFGIPSSTRVVLSVYDVTGRAVVTLIDGIVQAGRANVSWNGRSSFGIPIASGVYFVRLTTPVMERTAKLVHLGGDA
jgi:hypothetical protein